VSLFSGWLDNLFVDGLVNGTAAVLRGGGNRVRRLQTGRIQSSASSS